MCAGRQCDVAELEEEEEIGHRAALGLTDDDMAELAEPSGSSEPQRLCNASPSDGGQGVMGWRWRSSFHTVTAILGAQANGLVQHSNKQPPFGAANCDDGLQPHHTNRKKEDGAN